LKRTLELRVVNLALGILLILVMGNQIGFVVPLGRLRVPVTIADVVLLLAVVGVALQAVARRGRGVRLPPLEAFVLVLVAVIALVRAGTNPDAIKDVLQTTEYFLVAFAVFVNVAETSDLQSFITAFVAATAIAVVWAAGHYLACASPFDVRAGFENRNLLGAYLALALPVLYGIALHARTWRCRIGLLILVAAGLLVNLSGGALLATLVVLGVLSAVRGRRALIPYAALLGVALLGAPRVLPSRYQPHHTDALFSSVALKVNDNFLLSDGEMVERARELFAPTREIIADHSGERVLPSPRPLDADRLLSLLNSRRPLDPEEMRLLGEVKAAVGELPPGLVAAYPLKGPQVAVRYQRWNAAIDCARSFWLDRKRQPSAQSGDPFFGYGLRPYHELLKPFMPARLQYRTDEREVYNVAAPEPFTHNVWLKSLIQTGLAGFLALGWLVAAFLGRAARLYAAARSDFMLGVALGAIGGILGFALAGVFTENLVRGLAIPFVFVLAAVAIGERIVQGDKRLAIEKLTRYD